MIDGKHKGSCENEYEQAQHQNPHDDPEHDG